MTSPRETAFVPPLVNGRERLPKERPPLTVYPVETPAGKGWLGLHGQAIVWLSLGPLKKETVEAYWKGPVRRGRDCPVKTRELEALARGHGDGSLQLMPDGTAFQFRIWQALTGIPFSTTNSYGGLAATMGAPEKARAVGTAVGANPIAWLIPCHRVLPRNGGLGGYRWGAQCKKRLLAWEAQAGLAGDAAHGVQELRKLEEMVLNAQRFEDISRLAGDIAHDLNNLLAPIRMATELLRRNLADTSVERYVDIIEKSTGRARSVIQEILAFSREGESSRARDIAVRPVLEELEKMVRETFPRRISVQFSYARNTPPVRIDPDQLHRVVLNLLVNARDAVAGKGSITVRLSTHDVEMRVCVGERCLIPGRYVCIAVSDTGCGIPREIRDRIFDPFFTTKPKEQGTGLGLASVFGLIGRSGGFIDLESTEGKGTTFQLFLPEAKG